MASNVADQIAAWFAEQSGGEFAVPPREHPYIVVGPRSAARSVLYTSKPACVLHALDQCQKGGLVDVVGRYGVPREADRRWLAEFVGNRTVCFLGDCDPADLLLFASLRILIELVHLGVSDTLVTKLDAPWKDSITIPLAQCEASAIGLVKQVCPDYRELIGPKCAALLDSGRKLEIEAIFNFSKHDLGAILHDLSPQSPA